MPVQLVDLADGREIGVLTDEQFAFLADHLESEGPDDDDYYLNRASLDLLVEQGADPQVVALLRAAMADRADMDVRWLRLDHASEP
jgi:hypothetical protein